MNLKQIVFFSLGLLFVCLYLERWLLAAFAFVFISVGLQLEKLFRNYNTSAQFVVDTVRYKEGANRSEELPEIQKEFHGHIKAIEGERHLIASTASHEEAKKYISTNLEKYGWDVGLQKFRFKGHTAANVIGTMPGRSKKCLLFCCHYDTVIGTPGSDDNGSAVAAVLTLARLMSTMQWHYTIKLVAFDLEEKQGLRALVGSTHFVKNCRDEIDLVVNFEMIGLCRHEINSQKLPWFAKYISKPLYQQISSREFRGDFIFATGNKKTLPYVDLLKECCSKRGLECVFLPFAGLTKVSRDLCRSDHGPFWKKGIPALMLTDTANFRSGYYHTPFDLVETIDLSFATKVVESAFSMAEEIDALAVAEEKNYMVHNRAIFLPKLNKERYLQHEVKLGSLSGCSQFGNSIYWVPLSSEFKFTAFHCF